MLLEPVLPLSNGKDYVMKRGERHHVLSAEHNYGCSRSLARMCAWGKVSHRWRDLHVKIPSCLMHRAKENTALAQGPLTAERSKSMNESIVASIMGMNAC